MHIDKYICQHTNKHIHISTQVKPHTHTHIYIYIYIYLIHMKRTRQSDRFSCCFFLACYQVTPPMDSMEKLCTCLHSPKISDVWGEIIDKLPTDVISKTYDAFLACFDLHLSRFGHLPRGPRSPDHRMTKKVTVPDPWHLFKFQKFEFE